MVFLASLVNELHQDKLCGIPFDFKQTIRFDSFHFKAPCVVWGGVAFVIYNLIEEGGGKNDALFRLLPIIL